MKGKILLVLLMISSLGWSQSVPNTNTFSLQDVVNVVGGTSLQAAFTNSVDAYFDPTYKGSKDRLSNFRNYTIPSSNLPTVVTTSPYEVQINHARSGGNVTNQGGSTVTARGVCYSTITNPDINSPKVSGGSGTGSWSTYFSGLIPNKTYYIRAYATNSYGTAYGDQYSFTTAVTNFWIHESYNSEIYTYNTSGDYINNTGIYDNGTRQMLSYSDYVYCVGNNGSSYILNKVTTDLSNISGLSTSYDYITIIYSSYYNKIITAGQNGSYAYMTGGGSSWTLKSTSATDGYDIYQLVENGPIIYALCQGNRIYKSTDGLNFSLLITLNGSLMGTNSDSFAMCKYTGTVDGSAGALAVYGSNFYGSNHTCGVCYLNAIGGTEYTSLYLGASIGAYGGLYAARAYYSSTHDKRFIFFYEDQYSGLYVSDVGAYSCEQSDIYGFGENGGNILFGTKLWDGSNLYDANGVSANGIDIVGN